MCGIVGLVYRDAFRPCGEDVVLAMRDIFPYRGPDDAGLYVDGPAGLGHRRLSIIDLGGGHQPMSDPSGRYWVVFNGEIYNYRTVRQELVARGHVFRTQSDTEVILALYAERGDECVHAMNGMFAFAIWDRGRRSLFLARDRMGVKPLYYADAAGAFVFASEIKALFASGEIQARCREEALAEYLVFRQVAGNDSMFRGVSAVPPGCTMTWRDGQTRIRRYWSPLPEPGAEPVPAADAPRMLRELLEDSVRLRLISDVPVGTFCSGGVDSSLVTAIAARQKGEPVNTYSIGFDEADYDESRYAELVSKQYGTVHHELRVGNREFSELFPRMVWHNDEPLNFPNSVQIFALSRLAKERVTVVLTGEGSDELFAGYPRYRIPGLTGMYRRVPRLLRRLARTWLNDHRLDKLERYAAMAADDVLVYNSSYLPTDAAKGLAPGLPAIDVGHRQACLAATRSLGLDSAMRASLLDQETFLVSILHRQDKMSMAASIESRVPFMDYRVVEFANRVPATLKLNRATGKAIVKAVAREFLPSEIVDRRKSGFGVPLDRWCRADEGVGERILALPQDPAAGWLDRRLLSRLVSDHRSRVREHSELLWAALNLCTWRVTFRC